MPIVPKGRLHTIAFRILNAGGAPARIAERVATGLVLANFKGVDSHGVLRIPQYVDFCRQGLIVPDAIPEIASETATSAVIDAHQGFGHLAAEFATKVAITKARTAGVSAVTLRHTRHIGRVGEYVEMAIEAGFVGVVVCHAPPNVAPHGGTRPALGTNPIAIGLPSESECPFVLDMATSVMSEGKVRLARDTGKSLPPGVILGPEGVASIDAWDFYRGGALLPLGGYKGYGLSLTIELLGGMLAGAGTGLVHPPVQGVQTFGNGGLFIMLNPALFGDPAAMRAEVTEACRTIRQAPLREGFSEILIPGEPECRAQREREATGIPVADATWDALVRLGSEQGLDPELFVL